METKFDLYLIAKEDGSTKFCCDLEDIANHQFIKENNIRVKLVRIDDLSKSLRGLTEGHVQLVGYFKDNYKGHTTFSTSEGLMGVVLYQSNVSFNPKDLLKETDLDFTNVEDIIVGIKRSVEFFNCLTNNIN